MTDIREKTVHYTLVKKKNEQGLTSPDKRGRHAPGIQIAEEEKKSIRDHIESYPVMESHYCRSNSTKQYLDSNLNIKTMYRQYQDKCAEMERAPLKFNMYQSIFCNEYNYSFRKPKKDLCSICDRWEHLTDEQRANNDTKSAQQKHEDRKSAVCDQKSKDKKEATEHNEIVTVAFYLQKVL